MRRVVVLVFVLYFSHYLLVVGIEMAATVVRLMYRVAFVDSLNC